MNQEGPLSLPTPPEEITPFSLSEIINLVENGGEDDMAAPAEAPEDDGRSSGTHADMLPEVKDAAPQAAPLPVDGGGGRRCPWPSFATSMGIQQHMEDAQRWFDSFTSAIEQDLFEKNGP